MISISVESVPELSRVLSRPRAVSATMKHTIKRYKAAYKAVYGIEPTILVQGDWIKVQGQMARVKRVRLKELAEQLEYRAGSRG